MTRNNVIKSVGIGAIALMALTACGSTNEDQTKVESNPTSSESPEVVGPSVESNPVETTEPEPKFTPEFPGHKPDDVVGTAGDSITMAEGVKITASPLTVVTDYFDDTYLCTNVDLENGSEEQVSLSDWDFEVQTPNGQLITPTFAPEEAGKALSSAELISGGTASGVICYDGSEPIDSGSHLVYSPVFSWSEDRAVWLNVL